MARLLGEAADLKSRDHVLDVGFGYADQDLYWIEHFDVDRIVGVNITPFHVKVARRRVVEHGLTDRILLHVGSATCLLFEDGCFDKVLALECAFHFTTRERFFAEAFRVLFRRDNRSDRYAAPAWSKVVWIANKTHINTQIVELDDVEFTSDSGTGLWDAGVSDYIVATADKP